MAISATKQSAQELPGRNRLTSSAERRWSTPTAGRSRANVPTRWLIERGATRASAAVDVRGGFPGAARVRSELRRTSIVVSARYLVVGEGSGAGFALRLDELRGVGLVGPGRQAAPGIVVRYQDGAHIRTFGVTLRGLARTFAGRWRAEEVAGALAESGVPVTDERRIDGPCRLLMSWEEARDRANDALLWSGVTTAAVGGWFGARRRACRVWLTASSLFWSCREGDGVNRLALADITGVRSESGGTALVATTDGIGHLFELPFIFDMPAGGESPQAQLTALLEGLRDAGVVVLPSTAPRAPWRREAVER